MNKGKKITLAILAVMISATLIMIAVFSGTLAKFISTDSSSAAARVAKWGINVTSGTDLEFSYQSALNENEPNVLSTVVSTKTNGETDSEGHALHDNVVIPGTEGSLAWINVTGSPEKNYNVTVSVGEEKEGDKVLFRGFNVGRGFYAAERLIRDKNMLPVEYFPIIIELCAYDVDASNKHTVILRQTHALKKVDDTTANTDDSFYYTSLAELVEGVNIAIGNGTTFEEDDPTPNNIFNSTNNSSETPVNRFYTVNWKWNYAASDGAYQNDFLDTALCEAIANCQDKSLFEIGLTMNIQIAQTRENLNNTDSTDSTDNNT